MGLQEHINQINLSLRALDKRVCDIWHEWVSSIPRAGNSYYVLIAFSAWTDNSEQGSLLKRRVVFLRSDSTTEKIRWMQRQSWSKFACLVRRLLCQEGFTVVWIIESEHWSCPLGLCIWLFSHSQCKYSVNTQSKYKLALPPNVWGSNSSWICTFWWHKSILRVA